MRVGDRHAGYRAYSDIIGVDLNLDASAIGAEAQGSGHGPPIKWGVAKLWS
jgi:hypothetical protein